MTLNACILVTALRGVGPRFDLLPISILFKAGHRIQLKLSFADTATPRVTPAPTVGIYRDATHQSSLTLPSIEG